MYVSNVSSSLESRVLAMVLAAMQHAAKCSRTALLEYSYEYRSLNLVSDRNKKVTLDPQSNALPIILHDRYPRLYIH
eukprot:COSAG01_NODE_3974_length_5476_cov_20.885810_5_plen_77_part_00